MLNRVAIAIFALAAFSSALTLLSISTVTHLDADAAQYVAAARSLLRGNGYTTTLMFYEQQQIHAAPSPQTVWPPLFPALIAGYARASGIPIERAPVHIAVAAHIVTAVFLSALLARYLMPVWVSLLVGVAWFVVPEANRVILNGLSEPLFTLLTVLSAYSLALAFDTSRGNTAIFGLAGITAAGACLTRYQGIAFLGALIVAVLLFHWLVPIRRLGNRHIFALLAPPLLTVLLLFARNFLLVGSLSGGPAGAKLSAGTTLTTLQQFYWTGEALLGLTSDDPLALVSRLILVPGVVIMVCVATTRSICRFAVPALGNRQDNGHVLLLVVATAYVCALLALHLLLGPVAVSDARYLLVLTPFLFYLTGAAVCNKRAEQGASRPLRRGMALWIGISLVTIALCKIRSFEQSNWNYEWFAHGGNKNSKTIIAALESRQQGISAAEFLKARTEDGSAIMAPEPFAQFGGMILDRPSVGLTPPVFGTTRWTPEAVAKLIRTTNVSQICILTPPIGTYLANNPEWWPIVWLLLDGRAPPWLKLAFQTDKILIYQVERGLLPDAGH